MRVSLVLLALLTLTPTVQAQCLPWRRQVEQRLNQQDRLIAQLLQMYQQRSPGPIIVVPGLPRQDLPVPGQPRQPLPAPGQPRQPLPSPGKPLQPLPPSGPPRQVLPQSPPVQAQRYSVVIRALYYGGRR